MQPTRTYVIITTPYSTQQFVVFDRQCNAWTIKNAGNTLLNFDEEVLLPGESKSVGGNEGEIYSGGRKRIYFTVPSPAPATISNIAWLTQKIYVTRIDYNEKQK